MVVLTRELGPAVEGRAARTFAQRLVGLLGTRAGQTGGAALVFERCTSIHTFGMAYPLDVAFVDARGVVRRIERAVPPNRLLSVRRKRGERGAFVAVEREASSEPWFVVGERVEISEAGVGRPAAPVPCANACDRCNQDEGV